MAAQQRVRTVFAARGIPAKYTNIRLQANAPTTYANTALETSTASSVVHDVHILFGQSTISRRFGTGSDTLESEVYMPAYNFEPRVGDTLETEQGTTNAKQYTVTDIVRDADIKNNAIVYTLRVQS